MQNLTRLRSILYSSMHLRNSYKVLGFWSSGRKVAIFILSRNFIVNQKTPKLDPSILMRTKKKQKVDLFSQASGITLLLARITLPS